MSQYSIEEKLTSRVKLRETYDVKDVNGNLLGYVKGGRFKQNFWFEDLNRIRLAEVHMSKKGYRVYDHKDRLRATIRMTPRKREESRRFWVAVILSFIPMTVFFVSALAFNLPSEVLAVFLVSGFCLTIVGFFSIAYLHHKGKFGLLEYLIRQPGPIVG